MYRSSFFSLALHGFFILLAYYGLPSIRNHQIIEQPIDIVEDTPVSSKTSLKLGTKQEKEVKKIEKKIVKNSIIKKKPSPPPPLPDKKMINKKNKEIEKIKELKKITKLIKQKPTLKIKKNNKIETPKVISKPETIKKIQKSQLAKGILKTLTKPSPIMESDKKENRKNNNKDVLNKIRKIVGNSSKKVQKIKTNKLTQTDVDKIKNHISKCWNPSYSASELEKIIDLKISANIDGTVNSVEIVDKSLYGKDTFYRATADSARRAVLDCSPLPIPKNKAERFKSFYFDFDPSFISSY